MILECKTLHRFGDPVECKTLRDIFGETETIVAQWWAKVTVEFNFSEETDGYMGSEILGIQN